MPHVDPTSPPLSPPAEPVGSWARFRLGLVFMGLAAYFAFIGFRLVQLQVLVNPELQSLAEKQFLKTSHTAPHRLAIYDRNREELAVSVPASSVFARTRLLRRRPHTARILARVLGGSPSHWIRRLNSSKPFVWVQRQVSEDQAKKIAHENLPGIFTESENKRIYPSGPLAAPLLGFTDIDGNGLSGLELALNEELLERGSKFAISRDGKGNPSYFDKKYFRADDGKTGVYVTLDGRIQQVLEEELEHGMEATSAKGVLAVVMDPHTGEILALGERPTFDPNHVKEAPTSRLTNHVISSLYEPGSTMKALMAAKAIETGLLTPKSPIDCAGGVMSFGKTKIHDIESDRGLGVIPLEKVIQVSSNIGAARVAQTLGVARVKATLQEFGLNEKTGISLPGEAISPPKPDRFWLPITLATVGFGQGVSVTPLQMVAAYAPFANGGYRVRPRILLREGGSPEATTRTRVLSASTANQMREILVGVTESGTGKSARVPGISVAGKTGTAQKYEPGAGYEGNKYFSSFIGFLPAERPELLIGVFVDEPRGHHQGALTAGPVFKRIAERSLQILDRIPKRRLARQPETPAKPEPAVAKLPVMEASDEGWILPDLKGLSMREAIRLIGEHMENVKVSGIGYVESQNPKPGSLVKRNTNVALTFSPQG